MADQVSQVLIARYKAEGKDEERVNKEKLRMMKELNNVTVHTRHRFLRRNQVK